MAKKKETIEVKEIEVTEQKEIETKKDELIWVRFSDIEELRKQGKIIKEVRNTPDGYKEFGFLNENNS